MIQSITAHEPLKADLLRVPLADFAAFPIGSTFGRLKTRVKYPSRRKRSNCEILLSHEFERWETERFVTLRPRAALQDLTIPLPSTQTVLINQTEGPRRLGISHGEQFRFTCSTMSLLLDTLSMLGSYGIGDKPIESMFLDLDESGLEGDGTLVLTPRRAFQNTTATLQIALLYSEPALATYLKTAFATLRLQIANRQPAMPGQVYLDEPAHYAIESEAIRVAHEDGSREDVEFCDRIVADHRVPKFKDIVVRIRSSRADEQIEMLQELMTPEERERQRVGSSTKIVRYPKTSNQTVRLGRLQSEFQRLLPKFGTVKVRFDREYTTTKEPHETKRVVPSEVVAPVSSTAPAGSGGDMPSVQSGPIESKPFERPSVSARFLAPSDDPGLTPVIVSLEGLSRFTHEFLMAAYYLYEDIAHDMLPDIALGRGEEMLFQLPEDWGGFARADANGHGRFIAAIPIRFDNGVVWAIEILRRSTGEQFTMGLVATREYDDGLAVLGRIMRAVCDRVGRRRDGEDLRGTFPRADFEDVRIEAISHIEANWDGETLSQLMLARGQLLLSPERNF